MADSEFAKKLRKRAKDHKVNIIFFLKVSKQKKSRGLQCPLDSNGLKIKVLLTPGMILCVEKEEDNFYRVRWFGPTFMADHDRPESASRYNEEGDFTIRLDRDLIEKGIIVRVSPSKVSKMANHVPAVTFSV